MQQLLDEAHRAQPAAHGAAQHHAVEQQYAQHVPARPMPGGGQRVLDRAQGTGRRRAGAGIAVEPGHAGRLRRAAIDLAADEAPQVGVVQQRAVELYEPPRRGPAPVLLPIIQDRYTPYRY